MSILNPSDDAKVLQPVLDQVVETAADALVQKVIPALQKSLGDLLDGLTVAVAVSRKQN